MEPSTPIQEDSLAQLRHALMNPLTVVVGYAQLLAARRDIDDDVRTQLDRILEEARECVRIVEEARRTAHAAADAPAQAPRPVAARRRVLVVDDEPVILRLTTDVLAAEYDVTGIREPEEALRRLLVEDFDVVLLDLDLGGAIGGRELYGTLQLQQPEVAERVVFMTGGLASEVDHAFVRRSGRAFIQKPFQIGVLRDTVRRCVTPSS